MSANGGNRRRPLGDDERALWENATHSVVPLRGRAAKPVIPAQARKARPVEHAAATSGVAQKPIPPMQPLQRRQKQRLARGSASIDARIDLHGKTQSEAQTALISFLRRAQSEGARFVLVITGKGVRASGAEGRAGVLRRQVPLWLQLPQFQPYVVGFEPAHLSHGGEGALYIQLRRARAVI
jgi:DNA-nicking Smr family endonuclease